jgi:hypothetical protein
MISLSFTSLSFLSHWDMALTAWCVVHQNSLGRSPRLGQAETEAGSKLKCLSIGAESMTCPTWKRHLERRQQQRLQSHFKVHHTWSPAQWRQRELIWQEKSLCRPRDCLTTSLSSTLMPSCCWQLRRLQIQQQASIVIIYHNAKSQIKGFQFHCEYHSKQCWQSKW